VPWEYKMSTDRVLVKWAKKQDAFGISQLYSSAFPEHILVHDHVLDNPEFIAREIEDGKKFYVAAEFNNAIVGAAALAYEPKLRGGEIERVVVDPRFRGNGVCKNLCKVLVGEAHVLDLDFVEAFARGTQRAMQQTFHDLGFRVYGISPRFAVLPEGKIVREQFVHMGRVLKPDSVYAKTDLIGEAQALYGFLGQNQRPQNYWKVRETI